MGYLTLLEIYGSYMGLVIPLVWHYGNCFMNDSKTKLGTSLASDWLGISVAYGIMQLSSDGGGSGVKPSVF